MRMPNGQRGKAITEIFAISNGRGSMAGDIPLSAEQAMQPPPNKEKPRKTIAAGVNKSGTKVVRFFRFFPVHRGGRAWRSTATRTAKKERLPQQAKGATARTEKH